jgi:hypothetical protein
MNKQRISHSSKPVVVRDIGNENPFISAFLWGNNHNFLFDSQVPTFEVSMSVVLCRCSSFQLINFNTLLFLPRFRICNP